MTQNKLVWRLSKLPTPDELRELVKDKIITQAEAREILFSSETKEEQDQKSLESELKFLRELAKELSKNSSSRTVEYIYKYIEPYKRYEWVQPYINYCTNNNSLIGNDFTTTTTLEDGITDIVSIEYGNRLN